VSELGLEHAALSHEQRVLLHRTPELVRYHLMWRSSSGMTPMGMKCSAAPLGRVGQEVRYGC
jgi:hypothetical protein